MSSYPKAVKALSRVQWWGLVAVLSLSLVAALVVVSNMASKHGGCPSLTETSRPASSACFPAYPTPHNNQFGLVGTH